MTRLRSVVFLLISLAVPCLAHAQLSVFDLASAGFKISVEPGTRLPVVPMINRIPGVPYQVTLVREVVRIPPIQRPDKFTFSDAAGAGPCAGKESILNTWLDGLTAAKDEQEVKTLVGGVAALRQQLGPTCAALADPSIVKALDSTRDAVDLTGYVLERGEQLTVTITRVPTGTLAEKTWSFVLTTPPAGEWLTTWGFTFTQDRDDRFFLEPQSEDAFKIVRERSQDDADMRFVPSVFFHWLPGADDNANWSFSPFTAGLGVSKEAPAVMVGVSATRRRNVSLIVGGMFSRALRLDGIYKEDQVLKENVPTDKLHESTYRAGLFVSLAIRFGDNPFTEDKPKEPSGEGKEVTEKTPKEGEKGK